MIPIFDKLVEGISDPPSFTAVIKSDFNPRSGKRKQRMLDVPNDTVRSVQNRLLEIMRKEAIRYEHLRSKLKYSHGGIRGHSIKTVIQPHLNHRYFFIVDLKDAYHSVNLERLGTPTMLEQALAFSPSKHWVK